MTAAPMSLRVSLPSLRCPVRRFATAAFVLFAVALPSVAHAQIAVIGSTVEERDAAPGQHYEGTIVVRNLTNRPQPVRVYQTDYRFFADGTSRFDSAGSEPRSNAAWVHPSVSSLIIPPGTDVNVTYVVNVPAVDSLRGTYWSAVMIQGEPTAPPAAAAHEIGLGAVVRYAVQLATHVPTVGSRRVRLAKYAFAPDSAGTHTLEMTVENAGERAYRPRLWVELYDATGAQRARLEKQRGLLYPGSSLRQRFTFPSLPAGSYKAVVFADTGDETVSAAQYTLVF
jgi:hypothetical protein